MFVIGKSFAFSASHQLFGLAPEHPCGRLHGHNYSVVIELTGAVAEPTGMVYDFGDLTPMKRYIDANLDHRHLNDVVTQPTAEHLAAHLAEVAGRRLDLPSGVELHAVRVWETPTCYAEWRP